jgi:hypothetical protein
MKTAANARRARDRKPAVAKGGRMNGLRTWQRRHVNSSISEVTSVPGIGYWEACVSHGDPPRKQQVGQQFSLLTDAQKNADQLAHALAPHDCSLCGPWAMIDRRKDER